MQRGKDKVSCYTMDCAKAARILGVKIEFACYYCLKCHKNQVCYIDFGLDHLEGGKKLAQSWKNHDFV